MKRIKKNNIKLCLIVGFMILLLSVSIIALMNPSGYISFIYRNGLIIFIMGIMGVITSLFCIYFFGRKLISKNAVFTINDKGILDGVNILDYPIINWQDIIKIEECNVNNVPHLRILINNPEEYIRQKDGFKRWVLNFNYKKYQTPVLLNSTFLTCSFIELKKSILITYNEYKKSN